MAHVVLGAQLPARMWFTVSSSRRRVTRLWPSYHASIDRCRSASSVRLAMTRPRTAGSSSQLATPMVPGTVSSMCSAGRLQRW